MSKNKGWQGRIRKNTFGSRKEPQKKSKKQTQRPESRGSEERKGRIEELNSKEW